MFANQASTLKLPSFQEVEQVTNQHTLATRDAECFRLQCRARYRQPKRQPNSSRHCLRNHRRGSHSNASKDVLVIINNYTGDRLNFGLAIEKAHILWPKTRIESVVVADDVSLLGTPSAVGPRGLAGNILVCKILGAYAEKGNNLFTVKTIGDAVVNNMFSIGVGLEHCHVPGRKCEIGLGLHNEAGVKKAEIKSAEGLIAEMVELLVCYGHHGVGGGDSTGGERRDEYAVFVNNLGGMSQLEMGAILDETLTQFGAQSPIL
ncbi:DEAH-box ATP-dependent RNA helicase [Salix suchowensis]|nr:DEAH-box ATP-dependent RNA helicase [Salix suchowensis]